jgi:murein DD-endopeptidase MepM/ murein hydrolase activator NlpD
MVSRGRITIRAAGIWIPYREDLGSFAMTPTARPVRHTLYGTIAGAACGALLFLLHVPTDATSAEVAEAPAPVRDMVAEAPKGVESARMEALFSPPREGTPPDVGSRDIPAPSESSKIPSAEVVLAQGQEEEPKESEAAEAQFIEEPAPTEQMAMATLPSETPLLGKDLAEAETEEALATGAPVEVPDKADVGEAEVLETENASTVAEVDVEDNASVDEGVEMASVEVSAVDEGVDMRAIDEGPLGGIDQAWMATIAANDGPAPDWADDGRSDDIWANLPWDHATGFEGSPELTPDAMVESDQPIEMTITVSSGDTLAKLLGEQDIPRSEAHAAIESLREVFDPRGIRPGHELTLVLKPQTEAEPEGEGDAETDTSLVDLVGLRFEPSVGTVISLEREEDGVYKADSHDATLVRQVIRHDGVIQSSLFEAGLEAGASQKALAELIRIFSFDVDFQRDIRKDDSFQMYYEMYYTEDGRLARTGDIIYASMTLSGSQYSLYRFEDTDGEVDYYNEKGQGVRKALLRTPINGARLSSGFGMRHHPVLGYSKMHKGVDFAAPPGTPIYAAGDGIVEKAGPFSSYGNYVRIRHNSEFKTAYAHMQGFAKGITAGTRVKQGQVIGYVGTTGRSTGPHLHYEMLRADAQVNPLQVRFPSGKTLEGKELALFKQEREQIDVAFRATPTVTKVAKAD